MVLEMHFTLAIIFRIRDQALRECVKKIYQLFFFLYLVNDSVYNQFLKQMLSEIQIH